ncbi:MAG: hypothetical protein ABR577_03425 [Pyrinomonadaceae bacterium]
MGGDDLNAALSVVAGYGKYARIERERRFLLRELPQGLTRASKHKQICDNYITNTRMRLRRVRVPETNERVWKLTQKFPVAPQDFTRTVITNIYLSPIEYEMLAIFEGNEVRKNRYAYVHEERSYGVDVFLGELHGLVLAETEFASDEEMMAFAEPAFAAADVSNDEMFTGGKLAMCSREELRGALERYGLT